MAYTQFFKPPQTPNPSPPHLPSDRSLPILPLPLLGSISTAAHRLGPTSLYLHGGGSPVATCLQPLQLFNMLTSSYCGFAKTNTCSSYTVSLLKILLGLDIVSEAGCARKTPDAPALPTLQLHLVLLSHFLCFSCAAPSFLEYVKNVPTSLRFCPCGSHCLERFPPLAPPALSLTGP